MTKILSRKGVAFGAIVALGTTLIAGSPAMAADELALAPTTGSEVLIPTGMDFGMKTNYVPGRTPTDATKMKFKVTTDGGIRLNIGAGSSAANATTKLAVGTALADAAAVLANADAAADAILIGATTAVVAGGASVSYIALDTTAANTVTATATVQSWEDVNDNNTIDSGEFLSPARTMTFLKHTDITWTPTLIQPVVTAGVATSEVRITSNVNLSQMRFGVGGVGTETNAVVRFDEDTTLAGTFSAVGTAPTAPTYNSDDNRLVAVSGTSDAAFVAGDRVKASVYFNAAANDIATAVTGWTALIAGTGTYTVPVAATLSGIAVATTTATVLAPALTALTAVNSVANANVSATVAAAGTALAGTATFTVRTTATPASGQSAAGIPVTFTVAESGISSLATAARVVAGSSTLANTNAGTVQTLDVIVNTDADGIAALTIAATGTVDGNSFTVVAASQGVTGALATYTFRDRSIGAVSDIFAIGTGLQRVVAVSTAFDVPVGVTDQFGAPVSAAGFSVSVTDGASTVYANVINGVATASFPAYSTAGTRTLTVQGLKNGSATGMPAAITIALKVGTQEAVSTINYTGVATGTGVGFGAGTDADLGLNTETFIDVDTRTGGLAPTLDAQYTTVSASTFNASSTAVSADVTFSGTGLDFVSGGVYKKGSITVRSTDAGLATVRVYSSVAGSKTLTITSGTVVKTQTIVHLAAGVGTGEVLTVTAPASVMPGQSATVSGTLKDAFGNGVGAGVANNFRITYAGPGFTTAIPTSVDADGTFTFNVVTSTLDQGTGTVTVKYDQNADGDYADSTDLTTVKTFVVGRAAVGVINNATINGRIYVTVNNAMGYRVWVKIGFSQKPTFTPTSNKKLVSYFVGAGKKVAVRVYIRGGLAYSQNVTAR